VLAYGMRNPFRFTTRPGTNELWVGDVGWNTWEEINRITDTAGGAAANYGWPCYEGNASGSIAQPGYQVANLNLCASLYSNPSQVTAPFYAYNHSSQVVSGETCPTGGSSITGLAFYGTGSYPASYSGGLFFADHTRRCIWFMPAGANGNPDPSRIQTFAPSAGNPVDLEIGPGGDLFYADLDGGAIHRIRYTATSNQPPTAVITAQPTSGPTPLSVNFNGSGSTDPEGGALTYAWDLDGNGVYDNGSTPQVSWTYSTSGTFTARLRVTDPLGQSGTTSVTITAGNSPPVPTIVNPTSASRWKVGDTISFSGGATDAQDGTEPASRLSWKLLLHHCSSSTDCHVHTLQSFTGATGSFVAPDHGYPVYLELQLKATDASGLSATTTVRLDPLTVDLTFRSNPGGLKVTITSADASLTTPVTRTYVVNAQIHLIAPPTVGKGAQTYTFQSWSDGGAADHNITAPASATTYTAVYRKR
jgi:hypothetical protein